VFKGVGKPDILFLVITAAILISGLIDAKKYIIPNVITIPLIISGVVYQIYHQGYINLVFATAVALIIIVLALLTKGGIGGGDLKLLTGLALWMELQHFLYVVLISSFIGIVWGIAKKVKARGYEKVKEEYFQKMVLTHALGLKNGLEVSIEEELNNNDIVPFGACVALGYLAWFFPAVLK
jgi:Flp pilus assembly protein protease CpaA